MNSLNPALLVGLHVGQVVPQAHREAGILVSRILDEQATAEPLDCLALDDVRSRGHSNSLHVPASLPHVIRITMVPSFSNLPSISTNVHFNRCAGPRPRQGSGSLDCAAVLGQVASQKYGEAN